MKPKVYIEQASHKEKGKVYPGQQAQISVFDVGFQRSIGVFETMRTYQEKLFKLDEHLDRLANSVRQLELNNPWSKSELKERVVTALDKSNLEEATVRVILTGGEEQGLMEPNHPTLVIIVKDLHQYPESFYQQGVKVISFEGRRVLPQIKTLNYLLGFKALNQARSEKAHEAVYCNEGKLFEGITSNIFAVKDDIIVTPRQGVLPGITRNFVIELTREQGFKVNQKALPKSVAYNSDEIFLTSTHREILPVVQINDKTIGSGQPGSVSKNLLKEFRSKVLCPKPRFDRLEVRG